MSENAINFTFGQKTLLVTTNLKDNGTSISIAELVSPFSETEEPVRTEKTEVVFHATKSSDFDSLIWSLEKAKEAMFTNEFRTSLNAAIQADLASGLIDDDETGGCSCGDPACDNNDEII